MCVAYSLYFSCTYALVYVTPSLFVLYIVCVCMSVFVYAAFMLYAIRCVCIFQDLNWVKHFLFVFSLHSHIINDDRSPVVLLLYVFLSQNQFLPTRIASHKKLQRQNE